MTVCENGSDEKIRVAVRVRPLDKRELHLKTKCVVSVHNEQISLEHPSNEKQSKPFTFDHCFNSIHIDDPSFSNQKDVFDTVGNGVVSNAFAGYNACVFAYGQTGSGKSYTMMGTPDNPGLIPRLCTAIFDRIDEESDAGTSFKVEVSYMEIYNEKVHDLLGPKNSIRKPLKVREHTVLGPMVEGLELLAVSGYAQIARLLEDGNRCRTVAATNMNSESSRSHAVFTISLTQIVTDKHDANFTGEKVSKISLVDLAGSERSQKTGAMGKRLEEGASINKSLTTLGMVISALAERNCAGKREKFVPYRDSILTRLLKDNLGGNSKTVMIATVSPSSDNYEETLSTLRYADRAKRIVNHARVNEDPNAKIIRELREEIESLRSQITQNLDIQNEADELRERLAESERLVAQMNKSWEERLRETDSLNSQHQRDFTKIGLSVAQGGLKMERDSFYLVNLNADPSLNELLVYYIKDQTVVGSAEESSGGAPDVDILLQGLGVHALHALFEIDHESSLNESQISPAESRPRLFVSSLVPGARICVNGKAVDYGQKTLLCNGYRLLIGNNHFFRVNCPRDEASTSSMPSSSSGFFQDVPGAGYDRAWLEANGVDCGQNGLAINQYIEEIAIRHEEDKQAALEKQYEEFERYIQGLTQNIQGTPGTTLRPSASFLGTPGNALPPISFANYPRHTNKTKFFKWAQMRDELFRQSLSRLKTEIIRAHALAREANLIAEELLFEQSTKRGLVRYEVTLQIPASNLRPSKIKAGNSVCEPVIVVKWHGMNGWQLWSVERLENKLVDLRELYNDLQQQRLADSANTNNATVCENLGRNSASRSSDVDERDMRSPAIFSTLSSFESQEKHSLIGVANVFLEVLFHPLRLDYHVPIISQQGEVCGKLHVEVYRVPNTVNDENSIESPEMDSVDDENESESFLGQTIQCKIRIKEASNLPRNLSHFVFCQYSFYTSEMLVVAPEIESAIKPLHSTNSFRFNHEKEFSVTVTDEFLEYVQEDALSIEVWGHRSGGITEVEDESGHADTRQNAKKTLKIDDKINGKTSTSSNIASSITKLLSFGGTKNVTTNDPVKASTGSTQPINNNFDDYGNRFEGTAGASSGSHSPNKRLARHLSEVVTSKQKSLQERWAEVTKRVELWVEILEINEDGHYVPVDVLPVAARNAPPAGGDKRGLNTPTSDALNWVRTGGVYQLRQGQQRRICVHLRSVVEESAAWNYLPLDFADIVGVLLGSIVVVRDDQLVLNAIADHLGDEEEELVVAARPLDSYQEDDLERIRDQWLSALSERHKYLEGQIKELTQSATPKSESDWDRERSLISQWVELTEERNAVSLPSANSRIPGAPANWEPPKGIEYYVPITFLDLDAETLAVNEALEADEDESSMANFDKIAGLNNTLPFENFQRLISLPILEKNISEMHATCSWDSSIHACSALNRAPANASELIYACVNVICRLAHPFSMDVVLRKRICLSLYKRPSFTERILRRISRPDTIYGTGIYYDIVAHIPKSSLDMEERSALAMMAVRHTVSYGERDFAVTSQRDRNAASVSNTFTLAQLDLSGSSVSMSSSLDEDEDEEEVEYHEGVRIVRPRRQRQHTNANHTQAQNFNSYIENYTKAIQAVEWMLKLDRLRQESAMYSTISRAKSGKQRPNRRNLYNSSSFKMKRAISLPSTINKMALPPQAGYSRFSAREALPPAAPTPTACSAMDPSVLPLHSQFQPADPLQYCPGPEMITPSSNGALCSPTEMLTSAASSGYASMANSIMSPNGESGRLCGIDEEHDLNTTPCGISSVGRAAARTNRASKPPKIPGSFTVPETLNAFTMTNKFDTKTNTPMTRDIRDDNDEHDSSDNDNNSDNKISIIENEAGSSRLIVKDDENGIEKEKVPDDLEKNDEQEPPGPLTLDSSELVTLEEDFSVPLTLEQASCGPLTLYRTNELFADGDELTARNVENLPAQCCLMLRSRAGSYNYGPLNASMAVPQCENPLMTVNKSNKSNVTGGRFGTMNAKSKSFNVDEDEISHIEANSAVSTASCHKQYQPAKRHQRLCQQHRETNNNNNQNYSKRQPPYLAKNIARHTIAVPKRDLMKN